MQNRSQYRIKIRTPSRKTELALHKDEVTLGRALENDISIESSGISRKHLSIKLIEGEIYITDLNSTNGTVYQGIKLKGDLPVQYSGGELFLGPITSQNVIEVIKIEATTRVRAPDPEQIKAAALPKVEAPRPSPAVAVSAPEPVVPAREVTQTREKSYSREWTETREPVKTKEPQRKVEPVKEEIPLEIKSAVVELQAPPLSHLQNQHSGLYNSIKTLEAQKLKVETEIKTLELKSLDIRNKILDETTRYDQLQSEWAAREAANAERRQKVEKEVQDLTAQESDFILRKESFEKDRSRQEEDHHQWLLDLNDRRKREEAKLEREHEEQVLKRNREHEALELKLTREHEARESAFAREHAEKQTIRLSEQNEREEKLTRDYEKLNQDLKDSHETRTMELNKEYEANDAKLKADFETWSAKIKTDTETLSRKIKVESEEFASRIKDESDALEKRLKKETLQVEKEEHAKVTHLKDTLGREQSELLVLKKECADQTRVLADDRVRTENEHQNWKTALLKSRTEEEARIKDDFAQLEKKQRLQLETISAEISLMQAREQKDIEQRKTDLLVATRDLDEHQRKIQEAKNTTDGFRAELLNVQKQIEEGIQTERKVLERIVGFEQRVLKLVEEISEHEQTIVARKTTVSSLEQEAETQRKKLKTDYDHAMMTIKEERERILDKATKDAQSSHDHAQAKLKMDVDRWTHELTQRKIAEQESLDAWILTEQKNTRDKLSNDLEAFVKSATSVAFSQVQQNLGGASSMHKLQEMVAVELKKAFEDKPGDTVRFNPNRKQETRSFWVKSAVASLLVIGVGFLIKWAPTAIQEAAELRRMSHSDAESEAWIKQLQAEREQRLALKLEVRKEFQKDFHENVLFNEGYLGMKLDRALQEDWVKDLNHLLVGETGMGFDQEVIIEYIRVEHAMFTELAQKKDKMNALNKDDFMKQMAELSRQAKVDIMNVLARKVVVASDKARQTTAEEKWNAIRALDQKFYLDHLGVIERRPAAK